MVHIHIFKCCFHQSGMILPDFGNFQAVIGIRPIILIEISFGLFLLPDRFQPVEILSVQNNIDIIIPGNKALMPDSAQFFKGEERDRKKSRGRGRKSCGAFLFRHGQSSQQ